MNFLTIVLIVVVIALAFKKGVIIGIAALILGGAYIAYLLYPRLMAIKGQREFGNGNYEETKKCYNKVFKRLNFDQKVSYAYMLIRMGEPEKAVEILDVFIRIRALDPKRKNTAKRQRCLAYYKLGRYEESLRDAQDICESGFANKHLYGLMGMLMLVLKKDLDKTTKLCEEAYDYDEDDRDIQDNVSICYYLQKDYEMAKEINGYVREENPEFTEGYYHGAQIAVAQKDYKFARELLDKIPECNRTEMTTITEEAVKELSQMVDKLISGELTESYETPVFTLREAVAPPADFYESEDDEDGGSIYDEYNKLAKEESESIYDELEALEKKSEENGD